MLPDKSWMAGSGAGHGDWEELLFHLKQFLRAVRDPWEPRVDARNAIVRSLWHDPAGHPILSLQVEIAAAPGLNPKSLRR